MINRKDIVWVTHDGSLCYVNVERIIAINPMKRRIYFESVFWDLDENDFVAVWRAWSDIDIEDGKD